MNNFTRSEQRVPSLIEEALMGRIYDEPKDDGRNYIEHKYDDYKDVYNQLTPKEKSLVNKHPYLAYRIKKNRSKAFNDTSHFNGITDGYGDAIRHCYWSALNQMAAGLNSPFAKEFSDAHESESEHDIKAKAMDLYNNSVGYQLGNQAIINGWNEQELLNNVINAANDGTLQIKK